MGAICGIFSPQDVALAAPNLERLISRLKGRAPLLRADEYGIVQDRSVGLAMAAPGAHAHSDAVTHAVGEGTAESACELGEISGPWATARFDRKRGQLRLARDPLGSKPLFYFHDPQRKLVVFASEPAAILAYPGVNAAPSREGLMAYLRFGYIPAPLSAFHGIHKVFPGVALCFDSNTLCTEERFWHMPPIDPTTEDLTTVLPRIRQKIIASVERCWNSDDQPGLLLSGGLDSTIVLAALKELGARNIRTLSFGFERHGDSYTEDMKHARRVARLFGTHHEEVWIDETHNPQAGLEKLFGQIDEPFLTANLYSKGLVFERARQLGLRRCLTGSACAYSFERRPPEFLKKLRKLAGKKLSMENWTLFRRANLFTEEEVEALTGWPAEEIHEVCLGLVQRYAEDVRLRPWGDFGDFLFDTSMRIQSGEKALATMDRVSVREGIEVFHPLYDTQLHALGCTLPTHWKLGKNALRQAFRPLLPPEVLQRDVVGFRSLYWVRNNEIPEFKDRLLKPVDRGLLRPLEIKRIYEANRISTRQNAGKQTWGLIVLQAWLDSWFSGKPAYV